MNQPAKPAPPKSCPVCQVAMQATKLEDRISHRCQQCNLTITIAPLPKKNEYGSLSPRPFDLLVGTNLQTVDALESGNADVALMEWWDGRPGFLATAWTREPLVVITSTSDAWARRKTIAKSELFEEIMIGGEPGTGTGTLLQEVFGRLAKRLKVGYQIGSTAAVKRPSR